MELNVKLYWWY